MEELIKVATNAKGEQVISARELYSYLGVSERFSRFMERNFEYGFTDGVDYTPYLSVHPLNNQEFQDFAMKLDMAKEIAMIQRTEKGKVARMYFIECEKKLKLPTTYLESLKELVVKQELIQQQQLVISEQTPKVLAFENIIDSANTYTLDTASDILNIGRTTLCKLLETKKWKTVREQNGTSSTRFAEENGYAKTLYEYIRIGRVEKKIKRFVLRKIGLDKLIAENQTATSISVTQKLKQTKSKK